MKERVQTEDPHIRALEQELRRERAAKGALEARNRELVEQLFHLRLLARLVSGVG